MDPLQRAITVASVVMPFVVLAGLFVRRLARISYAWTAYLVAVSLGSALIALFPGTFWTWPFFVTKEGVYAVLKFGIALELLHLTFSSFPGAAPTARRALALGLVLTFAALVVGGPIERPGVAGVALALQPRLTNATALLLMTLWALIFWYNVPVHRLYSAILRGLVPYMLLVTITLRTLAQLGWDFRRQLSYADSGAYLVVPGASTFRRRSRRRARAGRSPSRARYA